MISMLTFNIPLSFELGKTKKRKYYLNLNTYRNLHYHVNSDLKIEVKNYIKESLLPFRNDEGIKFIEPVVIIYTIYPGSRRGMDLDNMVVIAKYVQDALVELGILEDDSYAFITNISFKVDKLDPDKKGYCKVSIFKENK